MKYKRGEVEALLRDRTEMRTQIVSLQKMITMRSVEEHKTDLNTGGKETFHCYCGNWLLTVSNYVTVVTGY